MRAITSNRAVVVVVMAKCHQTGDCRLPTIDSLAQPFRGTIHHSQTLDAIRYANRYYYYT
jgi:hypothetical protein